MRRECHRREGQGADEKFSCRRGLDVRIQSQLNFALTLAPCICDSINPQAYPIYIQSLSFGGAVTGLRSKFTYLAISSIRS